MVENGCYGPRKLLVPVAPDHSASRLSSRGNKRARDLEAVTSVASCWSLIEVLMRRQTFLAFVGATAASARPAHAQPQPRFEGMPNRLPRRAARARNITIVALHGRSREAPGARRGARGAEPRRHGYGSRGVKEDALACVAMALAMQKRIGELASAWRDAGIETPLRCRIGIHTSYCTVGNFSSEDRMDYTGGAVNLASRLQHEAPPGGVVISYETFAHVKDEMHCEPRGEIRVKGLACPVATYSVLGQMQDLEISRQTMRAEMPYLRLEAEPGRIRRSSARRPP